MTIGIIAILGALVGVLGIFAGALFKLVYETFQDLRAQNSALDSKLEAVRAEAKSDLAEFRAEVKSDFGVLDSRLEAVRAEAKSDLAEFRAEVRSDFAEFRAEVRSDFSAFRTEVRESIAGLAGLIISRLDQDVEATESEAESADSASATLKAATENPDPHEEGTSSKIDLTQPQGEARRAPAISIREKQPGRSQVAASH